MNNGWMISFCSRRMDGWSHFVLVENQLSLFPLKSNGWMISFVPVEWMDDLICSRRKSIVFISFKEQWMDDLILFSSNGWMISFCSRRKSIVFISFKEQWMMISFVLVEWMDDLICSGRKSIVFISYKE